ncbi:hypothetical protein M6D81_06990 [Paenibacillus sp. J5C_2022]|uniref:hypothetical protein n=1 Tax=Paenibacillus sp. J5C2022 TaxID=2977129 RepID=UPI0021D17097|nr:hypothetical protein [Paenibacillus sp. J5C2022]MCU6708459.1 hypothetical protein [Paenibacillus sp. J5C2022]
MKGKLVKIASATAVLGAGIWIGTLWPSIVEGDGISLVPGSAEDPVVTKSYVDEQIAKLKGSSSNGGNSNSSNNTSTNDGTTASVKLEVVKVPVGQILMADAGTEVVVRVGDAVAYSSDTNGISDVTEGKDIKSGSPVPKNHLIWFPREGRGIQAAEGYKEPLTVLVKGPYTLK